MKLEPDKGDNSGRIRAPLAHDISEISLQQDQYLRGDTLGLERALSHAINYHSLDAKLNMPDYKIAELIAPEVQRHLDGKTDVQIIEAMTPEQRAAIGSTNGR